MLDSFFNFGLVIFIHIEPRRQRRKGGCGCTFAMWEGKWGWSYQLSLQDSIPEQQFSHPMRLCNWGDVNYFPLFLKYIRVIKSLVLNTCVHVCVVCKHFCIGAWKTQQYHKASGKMPKPRYLPYFNFGTGSDREYGRNWRVLPERWVMGGVETGGQRG